MATTLTRLGQYLTVLDRKSGRLLGTLGEASPADLHGAPVPGAWSPLQVMHHLARVERVGADYLLYKFGEDQTVPRPQSATSRLKGKVAVAALLTPLKFKAPRPVDVSGLDLLDAPTLDDIGQQLQHARADLRGLLHTAPSEWLGGAIYRHPRAGFISLDDMGRMLIVHHDRHARQIERGLAQNARNHRR